MSTVFSKHPVHVKGFRVTGTQGSRLGFAAGLFTAMETPMLTVNF